MSQPGYGRSRNNRGVMDEGRMVPPHFFQMAFDHADDAAGMTCDLSEPWRCGFAELALDDDSIRNGVIQVRKAAGRMPDGTVFDLPGMAPEPPARPLGVFPSGGRHVEVRLGIPADRAGSRTVQTQHSELGLEGIGARSAAARWKEEVVEVMDRCDPENRTWIGVAVPQFVLFVGEEQNDGFVTMPLGRVVRNETSGFAWSKEFSPPLLDASSWRPVRDLMESIHEIAVAKYESIAALRSSRGVLAELQGALTGTFMLAQTVGRWIPALKCGLHTPRFHLSQVHQMLAGFYGDLTLFSTVRRPTDPPTYNHERPWEGLVQIAEGIREMLQTTVDSRVTVIPFVKTDEHYKEARINDGSLFESSFFYLGFRSEAPTAKTLEQVPSELKLTSADKIRRAVERALPTVPLTHLPAPPGAIPTRPSWLYFSLDETDPWWELVRQSRTAACYAAPDLFPGAEMELYAVRR